MPDEKDLITKMVEDALPVGNGTEYDNSYWEKTVDLVADVTKVDLLFVFSAGVNDSEITEDNIEDFIKNIHIEPNAKLTAVDIDGDWAKELMKAKYPGSCMEKDSSGNIDKILFRFDFTDYMDKLPLAIPKDCKNLLVIGNP